MRDLKVRWSWRYRGLAAPGFRETTGDIMLKV